MNSAQAKKQFKAHWENRKSLVSYACPERRLACKSLQQCDLPKSSQSLEKEQFQWYVQSNMHVSSYSFWVCSSNKHFMYNWAYSTCRNKWSLFHNWFKSFETCKLGLLFWKKTRSSPSQLSCLVVCLSNYFANALCDMGARTPAVYLSAWLSWACVCLSSLWEFLPKEEPS